MGSVIACVATPVAFPGAEGFGRNATGGRGGAVYIVTNLNDSGPGSLRAAVSGTGARTVVFEVAGTIFLQSTLGIPNGNLTIAGQTAPGDGICIANYPLDASSSSNVVIRFLRSRLGNLPDVENDAFSCRYANNVIVDHCSFSWSVDEVASPYINSNFTMQWCIASESLRNSAHSKGAHGYGGIWGGLGASFHHNLLAHNDSRNPRFSGAGSHGLPTELVDLRNNVIYNWGGNSCYGGEPVDASTPSRQNVVNNYYKYGPATHSGVKSRILNPSPAAIDGSYGLFHVSGNYVRDNATVTADNWAGGVQGPTASQLAAMRVDPAFVVEPVTTQSATAAYPLVLTYSGCVRPNRDPVDVRVVSEVVSGTFTYSGSVDHLPGIIDSQTDVGGWPTLATGTAATDTDRDGMPDAWENANWLNPNDASDRNLTDSTGYTRLEKYLNSLAASAFPVAEIIDQPDSVTIGWMSTLTLSVTAQAAEPLTYQWFKNGVAIANAVSPTYQVSSAKLSDAGSYYVEVSNPYSPVRSATAVLTYVGDEPPAITGQPSDTTAVTGSSASLTVSATGSPNLHYQWFTGSGRAVSGGTTSTLTFSPVEAANAGSYYVEVSDSLGTLRSTTARLTVRVPDALSFVFASNLAQDTIHAASPLLTPTSTNWYVMSSKNATGSSVGDDPATSGFIETRPLDLTMPKTSSGVIEAAARFAASPVGPLLPGQTLRVQMTFVPINVGTIGISLMNSGGTLPYTGLINSLLINSGTGYATGGTRNWQGYRLAATVGTSTGVFDARPSQPGTNNTAQALVVPGTSSSFPNVVATGNVVASGTSLALSDGSSYVWTGKITRLSGDQFSISCSLYSGTNSGGPALFSSSSTTTAAGALPSDVTSSFDAIAIGYRNLSGSITPHLTLSHLAIDLIEDAIISNPYEAFAYGKGLSSAANSDFMADPDGDNIENGLEFILGGDPRSASSGPLPVFARDSQSGWTFSFLRHVETAQVASLVIESSDDLNTWTPVGQEMITVSPAESNYERVSVAVPNSGTRIFFRLKVTR